MKPASMKTARVLGISASPFFVIKFFPAKNGNSLLKFQKVELKNGVFTDPA